MIIPSPQHRERPLAVRLSAVCLTAAVVAAPVLGGNSGLSWGVPALCLLAIAGGAAALAGRKRILLGGPVPAPVLAALALLGGCLLWWALQPAPAFASAFSERQWQILEDRLPGALWQLPRLTRLLLSAACLLLVAAFAVEGTRPAFRRTTLRAIAATGLAILAWLLGTAYLGFPDLPGTRIHDANSPYTVVFFHHGATVAALAATLPLGLALAGRLGRRLPFATLRALAVVLAAAQAMRLLQSRSGLALVAVTVVLGLVLLRGRAVTRRPGWLAASLIALLLLSLAGTIGLALRTAQSQPDGWAGAEAARAGLEERDKRFEQLAATRFDRLIPTDRPSRQAAWLTALRMAADHPLLGRGPGAWQREAALYSADPLVNSFVQHLQSPGHDPLSTAAECGVAPALLLGAIAVAALVRQCRRIAAADAEPGETGLLLALVALALAGLFYSPLQVPALQIWAAALAGLALAPQEPPGTRASVDRAEWR